MTLTLVLPAAMLFAPVPVEQAGTAAGTIAQPNPEAAAPATPLAIAQTQPLPAAPAESPQQQPRRHRHAKGDPLEGFNRKMFGVHQKIDKAVFRPVAMGYKHAVPKPVRSGIRNLLSNLTEPVVFVNYLLQGKPGKAAETLVRFALNTTVGVGGLVDVAKTPGIKLPHRDNGFGSTLALYGVGPGPYIFLPFVGPTTLRDALGGPVDAAVLPTAIGEPFDKAKFQIPTGVVGGLDERAEADDELRALFGTAVDPYATLRSVYLQNRAGEIERLRGKPAKVHENTPEFDDPLSDPAAASAPPQSGAPELQDPLADPAAADAPQAEAPAAAPQSDAPELRDPLADPEAPVAAETPGSR